MVCNFFKCRQYCVLLCALVSTNLLMPNGKINAQDNKTILTTEGVVGDTDDGDRTLALTYSTEISADGTSAKILVDTTQLNDEFKKYPISVEFFVNGKLFSKQFRSVELPAPLGIDVAQELAPIPFNYAIVATVLHPNRQYTTVAQGAVTNDSSSKSSLDCTMTGAAEIVQAVSAAISTSNELNFSLTQDDLAAEVSLSVEVTSSTSSKTATGQVVVSSGTSGSTSYDVTGTVEASGSVVSSLDVSSANGEVSLSCVTVATAETAAATVDNTTETLIDGSGSEALGDILGTEGSVDGVGPHGEPNFIPLDKVGGVDVVN